MSVIVTFVCWALSAAKIRVTYTQYIHNACMSSVYFSFDFLRFSVPLSIHFML